MEFVEGVAKVRPRRHCSRSNKLFLMLVCIYLEWEILTEEQKILTRSLRAKKGIKCEECGNIGYYTEICPNNCFKTKEEPEIVYQGLSRFEEDSADAVMPTSTGEGFFWHQDEDDGNEKLEGKPKIHRGNKKADLRPLKDYMRGEVQRLRVEDSQLSDYAYFRDAPEGYARDLSELTLHQVCLCDD